MQLIYTPRENPEAKQVWEYSQDRMLVGEVKAIEKVSGSTLQEFMELLERGSFTNIVTLFWIMRRRTDGPVALTDFDAIEVGELSVEGDDEPAEDTAAETEVDPKVGDPNEENSSPQE